MKRTHSLMLVIAALLSAAVHAQTDFPNGISFMGSQNASIISYHNAGTGRNTLENSVNGGFFFFAAKEETSRAMVDGGFTVLGTPISFVLETPDATNWDRGSFSIWKSSAYHNTAGSQVALFRVNSADSTAVFDSVAVNVANGSLSVAGSPVLTTSSAPAVLSGQGFITGQTLAGALKQQANVINGPFSNATGAHSVALGRTAVASGNFAFASGYSATATGEHSFAHGYQSNALAHNAFAGTWSTASGQGSTALSRSTASGDYSVALGRGSVASAYNSVALARGTASGQWSIAGGFNANASSYGAISFGSYNATSGNPNLWVETDPLFLIGNGTSASAVSNAIETLKNGRTTLKNKEWSSQAPLAEPSTTTSSGGYALIVNGHTELRGKVLIAEPQGDISMGIYAD
jgi:hypothetical protein